MSDVPAEHLAVLLMRMYNGIAIKRPSSEIFGQCGALLISEYLQHKIMDKRHSVCKKTMVTRGTVAGTFRLRMAECAAVSLYGAVN